MDLTSGPWRVAGRTISIEFSKAPNRRASEATKTSPMAKTEPVSETHTSAFVQVFGRRDDEAIHAELRPASEKRQGTKSREVGSGGAAGAMGILPRARA